MDAVKARGDEAVLEFTQRFDGATLTADRLRVTQAELLNASLRADESLRKAIATAAKNIEAFSRKSLRKKLVRPQRAEGAKVGEKFDAFQRVGHLHPRRHRAACFDGIDDLGARTGRGLQRNHCLHTL